MKYRFILFFLVIPILLGNLWGQSPDWNLNVYVERFPSPYYSDWETDVRIGMVTVNYSGRGPATTRLFADMVHERHGTVGSGETYTLNFERAGTVVLNNTEFIDWDRLKYRKDLEQRTVRSGLLPEGRYTACFELRAEDGITVLARHCANFIIVIPDPPQLVYPVNDSRIPGTGIRFQWSNSSVPLGYPITYEVKLWEYVESRNIYDIANNVRPMFTREVANMNELMYPLNAPILEKGKIYLWMVEIVSRGRRIFRDIERRSSIGVFEIEDLYHGLAIDLPDTLIIGEFVLIVTNYAAGSTLEDMSGTAVWLGCPASGLFTFIPIYTIEMLELTPLLPGGEEDEGGEGSSDIAILHSELFTPLIQTGNIPSLSFNQFQSMVELDTSIIGGLIPVDPSTPEGIEVNFSNLEAEIIRDEVGNIISGDILEDFDPPVPEEVKDFDIEIHQLFLTPDSAHAVVSVYLPCLYDSNSCEQANVGPFKTSFDPNCNIYHVFHYPVDTMGQGPYRIDDLGVYFSLQDSLIIDLSELRSPAGFPNDTAIIFFPRGKTVASKDSIVSNTGFLKGEYTFTDGYLTELGLNTVFSLRDTLRFETISPASFMLTLFPHSSGVGEFEIRDCRYVQGKFKAEIKLPHYVFDPAGKPATGKIALLEVDSTLSMSGKVELNTEMRWGGFGLKTREPHNQIFRITAAPDSFYNPVHGDSLYLDTTIVKHKLTGLSFYLISGGGSPADSFFVYTPDAREYFRFGEVYDVVGWLNVGMRGVSGKLLRGGRFQGFDAELGIRDSSCYLADSTFHTRIGVFIDSLGNNEYQTVQKDIKFMFAGNAAFDSDIGGEVDIPVPCDFQAPFEDMNVTSTGNLVGGNATFEAETLLYWGVEMASEWGVMSVKTGQIVFTNAAIAESVHYSQGFKIVWGEMFPDGDLGEFIFSQNTAGQKFDGFPVLIDSCGLSPFPSSLKGQKVSDWPDKQGCLNVEANIHFNFFGDIDTFINIYDYKYANHANYPYYNRVVQIDPHYFSLPFRDWGSYAGNSTADLDFDSMAYDSVMQRGFIGTGIVDYKEFDDSPLYSQIVAKPEGIKICMIDNEQHDLSLGPLGSMGRVAEVWGCIYIQGDTLSRIVVGGRLGTSDGIIGASATSQVMVKIVVTPTISEFYLEGDVHIWVLNGRASLHGGARVQLSYDRVNYETDGFIEGYFKVKEGTSITSTNVIAEVEGQINWHTGEHVFFQAMAKIYVSGLAAVSGGFFVGVNVPISKAWVLNEGGSHGKFSLDTEALEQTGGTRMSGMYAFCSYSKEYDFGIVAASYELFGGAGLAFISDEEGSVTGVSIIGNFGVYVYGEIFWGFVSASAWANLQIILPYPFYFKGTVGLKGCVLFVCKSIELDIIIDHDGIDVDW
ncbi:hypothetical protein JW877_02835 [bacterium]|nr:hypothetical protein [bacterium]